MATFNNTASSNPVSSALTKKLNISASPLSPAPFMAKNPAMGIQTTTPPITPGGLKPAPTPAPKTPVKNNTNLASPLVALSNQQNQSAAPTTPTAPTSTPAPTPAAAPAPTNPSTPTTPDTNSPGYLFNLLTNKGVSALDQSAALTGQVKKAEQDVAGNPNYSLDTQVGRQGLIQQNIGTQAQALAQQGSAYLQGANLTAPQPYSLSSQPYFPGADTYGGGGANGAIGRSVQLSNINSAGDFNSKIQATSALKSTADADISVLQDYAKGIGGDVPITKGLSQLFGNTVQGNQAVAGFQAKLGQVRSEYQQINPGVDPIAAIPDNVTPNQLKTVQEAIASGAQNLIAGYQKQLGSLQGGAQGSTQNNTQAGGNNPLGI